MWRKKKKKLTEGEQKALDMGRQFFDDIDRAFEEFLEYRFTPVQKNYLDILRGRFQEALHGENAPPLTLARIEYKIFLEQLDDMRPKMAEEIYTHMENCVKVADEVGVRSEVDYYFEQRIEQFATDLSMEGLNLLDEYSVPITDAEKKWRQENPERAAEFPEGGN